MTKKLINCPNCASHELTYGQKRRNRKTCKKHITWFCRDCGTCFTTPLEIPPLPKEKKTFQRNWHSYNLFQMEELKYFQEIAFRYINQNIQNQARNQIKGRPSTNRKDMIFCCLLKIYFNKSSRRLTSILKDAETNGWIEKTPHFTTIIKYFNHPDITKQLLNLIEQTSKELSLIERSFSIDATGFTSTMYESWCGIRYEEPGRRRLFKKVHVMCGNKTQIITAVKITDGHAADTKQFYHLLHKTKRNFKIQKVCADKAYLSVKNYQTASKAGAIPYIPFKEDSTRKHGKPAIWKTMYREFKEWPEHYAKAYHERSQIESCFSSIKRKFGERLFTKNDTAQENEILTKVLAHNICILTKVGI